MNYNSPGRHALTFRLDGAGSCGKHGAIHGLEGLRLGAIHGLEGLRPRAIHGVDGLRLTYNVGVGKSAKSLLEELAENFTTGMDPAASVKHPQDLLKAPAVADLMTHTVRWRLWPGLSYSAAEV